MTGLSRAVAALTVLACLFTEGRAFAQHNVAGEFDYYVLVLSWMPSYCRTEGRDRKDAQCEEPASRGFLLHGLWPQFDKGWPENCPVGKRPWVPESVIQEMRDIMPSRKLVIHEYRAHGTCSGLEPAQYFGVARDLYERINVPVRFIAPGDDSLDTPEEIEREFLDANPWLSPEMIAVSCRRANLLDIRVCFGRDLSPRACGLNEDEKRLCPLDTIVVPPVTP
jgi:ribonuclease T2